MIICYDSALGIGQSNGLDELEVVNGIGTKIKPARRFQMASNMTETSEERLTAMCENGMNNDDNVRNNGSSTLASTSNSHWILLKGANGTVEIRSSISASRRFIFSKILIFFQKKWH